MPRIKGRKKKKAKRSSKDSYGKISSYEMQCVKPDHNMCQIDEVPTNLQMKEIATEVPIRMNVVLPECWVVLDRLTAKEINQPYPDIFVNGDISNKDSSSNFLSPTETFYNEHNYSQSADLEKTRYKRKRLRHLSKGDNNIFELYKQKRKRFLDRQNGTTVNSENILTHSDESASEMSEDDFQSPNNQIKGKKKLKRGKYERDSEWCPHTTKNNVSYGKRLRRQVRRPIIDSDSSTTDQEEMLYQLYTAGDLSCDSSSTNSAFHNAVPSDFESNKPASSSSSSVNKISVEKDLTSHKVIDTVKVQNSSHDITLNTKSAPDASANLDIVANIMKEMDNCKRTIGNLKPVSPCNVNTMPVRNNIKPKTQTGRKRNKPSDNTESKIDSIVHNVLQEILSTVCKQLDQQLDGKKIFKKCIWCHTQFPTSKADEIMCNICYDQGKGKYLTSSQGKSKPFKDKILKGQKQAYGSRLKISSTMSRVLKILPKTEMQRLIYTEKASKLSNEKGYSHCKSFTASKEKNESNSVSEKSQEAINAENLVKSSNQVRRKKIKKCFTTPTNQTSLKSDSVNSLSKESESVSQNIEKDASSNNKSESERLSRKRSRTSFKKFNEGLFLMSFPDSGEELNIEKEDSLKSATADADTSCSLPDNSRVAKSSEKSVSPPKKAKRFQSDAEEEDFKTYLIPPVCTVVVANYSCKRGKSGKFHLTHIFLQNEFTHQHASNNSVKVNGDSSNLSKLPTCSISHQDSSSDILNNAALTITSMPVIETQSFTSNSSPFVIDNSVPSNTTILPVVSSVVSLSEQSNCINKNNASTFPSSFVNSEQLSIKILSVSSEKQSEDKLNINSDSVINCKSMNDNKASSSSESTSISKNNQETEKNVAAKPPKTSNKRKHKNSQKNLGLKTKKKGNKQKEKHSSDTDISDRESGERVSAVSENVVTDTAEVNIQNSVDIANENITKTNTCRNSENIIQNSIDKSDQNISDILKHSKSSEPYSDLSGLASEVNNDSAQKSVKPTETEANTAPLDPINSAIDLLGAVAILGVIDLEKNPLYRLSYQVQITNEKLAKLMSENNITPEVNKDIALCRYNIKVFEIAQKYLNLYGSFEKVTEHLMRRHQIEQKIQIKKEMMDEDEDEEGTNQSSCRFSQRPQSASQLSNETFANTPEMPSASPQALKLESISSCRLNEQASALSHLEKLQSQIAAMNNTQANYDALPSGGTVHHYAAEQYAAYTPAVAAPAPLTPRNDCMGGESRETPSRGSGPRTPARPESATSQPDEQSLALQVKREHFEAAVSSPSQCAYTQNTTLTQMSSQVPVIQDVPVLNTGGQTILNNSLQQIAVSGSTVNQIYTSTQSNYLQQSREVAITRAPPSYSHSKHNYTNVLLNIVPRPQAPTSNVTSGLHSNVDQTGQLLFGQQLYIPGGNGLPQKQAVPSNQYIIQQPFSAPNNGGTVIVNNSQGGGQNVNALLTNVSNQQFYTNTTNNQVPQLYYPPTSQIACTPSTMPAPNVTIAQNQGARYRNFVVRRICRFRDDHNVERRIYLLNITK